MSSEVNVLNGHASALNIAARNAKDVGLARADQVYWCEFGSHQIQRAASWLESRMAAVDNLRRELAEKDAEIERYERVLAAAKAMIDRLDSPRPYGHTFASLIDTGALSDVLVELREAVKVCE